MIEKPNAKVFNPQYTEEVRGKQNSIGMGTGLTDLEILSLWNQSASL